MGYKQYNLELKQIRIVGDNKRPGETNFGAVALNGKTAYCLKTNSDNTKSDLFCYSNYKTSGNPSPIVIKNKLVQFTLNNKLF